MPLTTSGQCKLCGEWIPYTVGDPVELGAHMMERHSDDVGQYAVATELPPEDRVPCEQCSQSDKTRPKRQFKRDLYKTTLETWTTSSGYMQCPSCGKRVKPLIRSQKHKVAYTSLGATFLLSCWPLCFMFPPMHKCAVDLYCPNCKYALGVRDSDTFVNKFNYGAPNIR